MASLLALARAEIEEAKLRFRASTWMHAATLVASLTALFATPQWTYKLAVLALLTEGIAWWLRHVGMVLHATGEEARRRILLVDALGSSEEPLDVADLNMRFSPGAQRKADTFEDPKYYASDEPAGPLRLRHHLQEGAFWSKYLYENAAKRSRWFAFGVPVTLVLGVALAWPLLPLSVGPLFARTLVVFLSFLFAVDEFGRSLSWSAAAMMAERVDRRLENLKDDSLEPVLATFGDYSVATALAPPIPTAVYQAERERINKLWRKRLGR